MGREQRVGRARLTTRPYRVGDRLNESPSLALFPRELQQVGGQRHELLWRNVAGDLSQLVFCYLGEEIEDGEVHSALGDDPVREEGLEYRLRQEEQRLERRAHTDLPVAMALRHGDQHLRRREQALDPALGRDRQEPLEQACAIIGEAGEPLVDAVEDRVDQEVHGIPPAAGAQKSTSLGVVGCARALGGIQILRLSRQTQPPGGRDSHMHHASLPQVGRCIGDGEDLVRWSVEKFQELLDLPVLDPRVDAELGDAVGLQVETQRFERGVRAHEIPTRPHEALPAHPDREDGVRSEEVVERPADLAEPFGRHLAAWGIEGKGLLGSQKGAEEREDRLRVSHESVHCVAYGGSLERRSFAFSPGWEWPQPPGHPAVAWAPYRLAVLRFAASREYAGDGFVPQSRPFAGSRGSPAYSLNCA